ncbi:MAG: S8 family serine peptidase [Bacteroidales bacterium]|nr:S8 family serine peptidase [Bacteroidales bacterium]
MKKLLLLFFLFNLLVASAQSPAKYWVQFKDKKGTPYSVARPEEFLSPRAIAQRQHFRIPVTTTDLPVNPEYVRRVLAADSTAYLCVTSKWLNGITIYSTCDSVEQMLGQLPFVSMVECTSRLDTIEDEPIVEFLYLEDPNQPIQHSWEGNTQKTDYGNAANQMWMNNAQWLHRMGYHGEGMQMMVMDGGFVNVDSIPFFQTLRDDHRLLGARNFVQPDQNPFRKHSHGTMVLSCIAAYTPGKLLGTAPMAQVYLCQTEDARSETKVEEDYWVAGLEWADSLGCQVLNSSLGYTTFDDTVAQRRSYEDLNGLESRASRAASVASVKGMIICNSAGNAGSQKWKYLGTPADANGILTVGAVMGDSTVAGFSSWGPTADGRVKPDACAVGLMAAVCNQKGKLAWAAGTSFSSPILSGMVACLWQAFPDKTNVEIMEAVRKSGQLYENPDDQRGYGITDFLKAYNILRQPEPENGMIWFDSYVAKKNKKGNYELNIVLQENENTVSHFSLKSGRKMKIKKQVADLNFLPHKAGAVMPQLSLYTLRLSKLSKQEEWRLEELEIEYEGNTYSYVVGQE